MRKAAIILIVATLAGTAQAKQPLHEHPTVISGFYWIGLANEIRKNCETINPRVIRAFSYLRGLHRFAQDNGYSDEEIQALIDNKEEQEALKARIRADLKRRGASPQTPEGYCTVGREEIAKNSNAGRLLRAD